MAVEVINHFTFALGTILELKFNDISAQGAKGHRYQWYLTMDDKRFDLTFLSLTRDGVRQLMFQEDSCSVDVKSTEGGSDEPSRFTETPGGCFDERGRATFVKPIGDGSDKRGLATFVKLDIPHMTLEIAGVNCYTLHPPSADLDPPKVDLTNVAMSRLSDPPSVDLTAL